jgi:hypothetical protein
MTQQSNDKSKNFASTPSSRSVPDQGQGMTDQGMFGQGPGPTNRSGESQQGLSGQLHGAVDQVQDTFQNITQGNFSLQNLVSDRPLMVLGAAVAAGYVLGSMAGDGGHEERDRGRSVWEGWEYQPVGRPGDNRHQGYSTSFTGMPASRQPGTTAGATSPAGAPTTTYGSTSSADRPAGVPAAYTPSRSSYKPQEPGFFDQFDQEIDMLKSAAITTIRSLLRDNVNEYLAKLNIQHQRAAAGRPANLPAAEEYTRERNIGR